jgi:hypothetical protein
MFCNVPLAVKISPILYTLHDKVILPMNERGL